LDSNFEDIAFSDRHQDPCIRLQDPQTV